MHPKTKNILTKKNIKEKKRHEIERMSQLTANIANEYGVKYIVDFGAGLGHLARLLAYGHRLNVCCLEMQIALTKQAKYDYIRSSIHSTFNVLFSGRELDSQLSQLTSKYTSESLPKPVHLNICLTNETPFDQLVLVSSRIDDIFPISSFYFRLQEIKKCFGIDSNDRSFQFGIIGLHPCGDLAAILTNFFLRSAEAKFLNLVGCCYFKITVATELKPTSVGYPLSKYLQSEKSHLSFEAREIACHAIEVYGKRLSNKDYDHLRVHSFRAAIEKIICKYWPERKNSGLRSIKHLTTFRNYCQMAVNHLDGVEIPEHEIDAQDTLINLNNWKSVVIFYTLRLMLAPLVESVILYDRVLFLMENGKKMISLFIG